MPAWLSGVLLLCAASALFAQATDDRYSLPQNVTPVGVSASKSPSATPAPPAWNDGASVYLDTGEKAVQCDTSQGTCSCPVNPEPGVFNDPRVATAAYRQERPPAASEQTPERRLAPPSDALRADAEHSSTAAGSPNSWGLPLDSLVTTIAALVLVIGLFLLCMWALRRGSRIATGHLPKDAVSVLGSMPLAGRQMAQLLRVGGKLVLISVTPSGAQPLVEVTDPAEVDRLSSLCLHGELRSASRGHERTLRQQSTEPTLKGLPSLDLPLAKAPPAPDLFRAYQGATERA